MQTIAQIITITVLAQTIMFAIIFGALYRWTAIKLRNYVDELDRRYERTE